MHAWSALNEANSWVVLLIAALISAATTWSAIAYARRRGLIDDPGQRRSHAIPTPRGGGIGIVLVALLGFCLPWVWAPQLNASWIGMALSAGFLAVAAVGWWDDHHALGVGVRIATHFAAACALAAAFWLSPIALSPIAAVCVIALLVLSTVWSINLHNFMDGINGLLASQAISAFATFAYLSDLAGAQDAALRLAIVAAACLGFLPFNFPRARVFMGDVGSGALGYLFAAAVWLGLSGGPIDLGVGALVCSAFVVDTSATLLSRFASGRRWYSAHREHLYQWLVRSSWSHAQVVGLYMLWNAMVVLPALAIYFKLARGGGQTLGTGADEPIRYVVPALVYLMGLSLWILGKRACLLRAKALREHNYA